MKELQRLSSEHQVEGVQQLVVLDKVVQVVQGNELTSESLLRANSVEKPVVVNHRKDLLSH